MSSESSSTENAGRATKATKPTIRMVLICKVVGKEWESQIITTFTPSPVSDFGMIIIIIILVIVIITATNIYSQIY